MLDGKLLAVASPGLRKGFVVVDLMDVGDSRSFASTIRGAFKYGKTVDAEAVPRPNLIIEGSVAVDTNGHRLVKVADMETWKFGC